MALDPVMGWQGRVFVGAEVTFGTMITIDACDAIQFESCSLGADWRQQTRNARDRSKSRSRSSIFANRVRGRYNLLEWELTKAVRPGGAAGTRSDDGDLWECALGFEDDQAAYVSYGFSDEDAMRSLSLHKVSKDGEVGEGLAGAIVTETTINVSATEEATVTFRGQATTKYRGVRAHIDETGGLLSEIGDKSYDFGDATYPTTEQVYGAQWVLSGGTEQILVTNVDRVDDELDVTREHGGTKQAHAEDSFLDLYCPTPTYTGAVCPETDNHISFDGGSSSMDLVEAEVTIVSGMAYLPDESGTDRPQALIPIQRGARGSATLHCENGVRHLVERFHAHSVVTDLQLLLGSVAGEMLTVDMPTVEIDELEAQFPDDLDTPQNLTVGWECLPGTYGGSDEILINFN